LADRCKPTARHRTSSVDKNAAGKNSALLPCPLSLPNIAELITEGEITNGVLRSPGTRPGAASVVLNLAGCGKTLLKAFVEVSTHKGYY
jgi:hypothetical protein